MSDPIVIKDDYVVAADQDLDFTGQAFRLKGADAWLHNLGEVTVQITDPDDVSAVTGDAGNIVIEVGGSLTVEAAIDGTAYGFLGVLDSFDNEHLWVVRSTQGAVEGLHLDANASVINCGTFAVSGPADALGVFTLGGTCENEGTISVASEDGDGRGVEIHGTAGVASSLTNTGLIWATGSGDSDDSYAVGYSAADEGFVLTNHGVIQSNHDAIRELQATDAVISNDGWINGDVRLGLGADEISNTGKINGDVDLGSGEDHYHGGGRLRGELLGGLGDDILAGGKGSDVLHGDTGVEGLDDGNDQVSGGAGADRLYGEGGDDSLAGGVGGDTLTGGSGADAFVYLRLNDSHVGKSDLIADLDGSDHIDLSGIDADKTVAGNQAFVLVNGLDGHAGEAALSYDAGADRTTLALDVDGDGQADAAILLTGDQTGFSGWVL